MERRGCSRSNIIKKVHRLVYGQQRRIKQNRQILFVAACNGNAMPNLQYYLDVIPLLEVVQTTSLLGESTSFKNLLCYYVLESAKTQESIGGFYMNRLAHTSWECKYHIILAPKFRRQAIYGKLKVEIGIRDLCDRKGIEIIAA